MSRGLGKVQRAILAVMEDTHGIEDGMSLDDLTWRVGRRVWFVGLSVSEVKASLRESHYASVRNAVRRLIRDGHPIEAADEAELARVWRPLI